MHVSGLKCSVHILWASWRRLALRRLTARSESSCVSDFAQSCARGHWWSVEISSEFPFLQCLLSNDLSCYLWESAADVSNRLCTFIATFSWEPVLILYPFSLENWTVFLSETVSYKKCSMERLSKILHFDDKQCYKDGLSQLIMRTDESCTVRPGTFIKNKTNDDNLLSVPAQPEQLRRWFWVISVAFPHLLHYFVHII